MKAEGVYLKKILAFHFGDTATFLAGFFLILLDRLGGGVLWDFGWNFWMSHGMGRFHWLRIK